MKNYKDMSIEMLMAIRSDLDQIIEEKRNVAITRLSDTPIENIKTGLKVLAPSGTRGVVKDAYFKYMTKNATEEDFVIYIRWSDGFPIFITHKKSSVIMVLEDQTDYDLQAA